jgi:epoxyqueuosine reductase
MSPEVAALTHDDWHSLTPERHRELFRHSAMERAGYDGLMRNIKAVGNKFGTPPKKY